MHPLLERQFRATTILHTIEEQLTDAKVEMTERHQIVDEVGRITTFDQTYVDLTSVRFLVKVAFSPAGTVTDFYFDEMTVAIIVEYTPDVGSPITLSFTFHFDPEYVEEVELELPERPNTPHVVIEFFDAVTHDCTVEEFDDGVCGDRINVLIDRMARHLHKLQWRQASS